MDISKTISKAENLKTREQCELVDYKAGLDVGRDHTE